MKYETKLFKALLDDIESFVGLLEDMEKYPLADFKKDSTKHYKRVVFWGGILETSSLLPDPIVCKFILDYIRLVSHSVRTPIADSDIISVLKVTGLSGTGYESKMNSIYS